MAGIWEIPGPPPLPLLVDHPHERTHQHQSLLAYLANRTPKPKDYPNYPDVDIRDIPGHYLIDVEVPGVKDVKDLHVQWNSDHQLIVYGETFRPGQPKESEAGGETTKAQKPQEPTERVGNDVQSGGGAKNVGEREAKGIYHAPYESHLDQWLLVGERRIGFFRRVFTMPLECDIDNMKATLEAGLLCLEIPKMHHLRRKPEHKVRIENKG